MARISDIPPEVLHLIVSHRIRKHHNEKQCHRKLSFELIKLSRVCQAWRDTILNTRYHVLDWYETQWFELRAMNQSATKCTYALRYELLTTFWKPPPLPWDTELSTFEVSVEEHVKFRAQQPNIPFERSIYLFWGTDRRISDITKGAVRAVKFITNRVQKDETEQLRSLK